MRQEIDVEEVGVQVQEIRKTKSGNIRFTIKEKKEGAVDLFKGKALESLKDKATAKELEPPRKVIIIRDILEETSEEKIKEAIVDTTGIETHRKDIKINTLRATKKGHTMVATVSLHKKKTVAELKLAGKDTE